MCLRAASRVTRVPGHPFDFRANRMIQRSVPVDESVAVRIHVLCLSSVLCLVPIAYALTRVQMLDSARETSSYS